MAINNPGKLWCAEKNNRRLQIQATNIRETSMLVGYTDFFPFSCIRK